MSILRSRAEVQVIKVQAPSKGVIEPWGMQLDFSRTAQVQSGSFRSVNNILIFDHSAGNLNDDNGMEGSGHPPNRHRRANLCFW